MEARQRELEELERDTRTVFAHNLPTKADERDIFQFFSQARGRSRALPAFTNLPHRDAQ